MARLFRFILVLSGAFLFSCTGQNKADLTRTCFFDDPVSDHGVQVETGSTMHYIWIDLFHNLSDMDYMKENHQMQDE